MNTRSEECPSVDEIAAWLARRAARPVATRCADHIDACETCRRLAARIVSERTPPPVAQEGLALLGRYELRGVLGRGGMGIVYDGWDPQLGRRIAIKVVRADLSDTPAPRTLEEARAVARVVHPNVVRCLDVGASDRDVFLVMEYLEGETLRHWARGAPALERVLQCLLGVAQGLAEVHRRGVVHRDVKPDNIIVCADDRAKLIDFGIAAARDEGSSTITMDRDVDDRPSIIGTPRYMAPEQLRGERATPASDQFSFCLVVFEMLYGALPPERARSSVYAAAVAGFTIDVPSSHAVAEHVGRALARGLSWRPEDRFASVAALLEHLRHRRRRRIAQMATVVTSVALAPLLGLALDDDPCSKGAERIDAVWGPSRAEALDRAWRSAGQPRAVPPGLIGRLDTKADSWRAAWRQACTSGGAERDRRLSCLRRTRDGIANRIESLFDVDTIDATRAWSIVAAITPPTACLGASPPPGVPPTRAAAIASRQADLAEIRLELGDADGLTELRAALTKAIDSGHAKTVAQVRTSLGGALVDAGRYDEAVPVLEQALWGAWVQRDQAVAARAANMLTYIAGRGDRPEDALRWARWARTAAQGSPAEALLLAGTAVNEAFGLTALGRSDEAIAGVERAVQTQLEHADEIRGVDRASSLNTLGGLLADAGRYDEAFEPLLSARELFLEELGPRSPLTGMASLNLAGLAMLTHRVVASVRYARDAVDVLQAQTLEGDPRTATAMNLLAMGLQRRGSLEQAAAWYDRALDALDEGEASHREPLATTLLNASTLQLDFGSLDEADAIARQARAIAEALPHSIDVVAKTHAVQGAIARRRGDLSGSDAHLLEALRLLRAADASVALALAGLGENRRRAGQLAEARDHLERALELSPQEPLESTAVVRWSLAQVLWDEPGQRSRAQLLLAQAEQGVREALPIGAAGLRAEIQAFTAQHAVDPSSSTRVHSEREASRRSRLRSR